ncbi:MAG: hypothetical protein EZS28_003519 [Streblomastix strix]|uniref:Uncharacterized protein n=1 Tax=Streblomastix strix TaxID=222440 RepID=A0A5J4X2H8_9EUKA|nr:MAG: hypothetical protein EZS28_003519 [Streblomastix strix]
MHQIGGAEMSISRWSSFRSSEVSHLKGIADQAHYGHIPDDTKCRTQVQGDQRVRQLIRLEKVSRSEWWKPSHFSINARSARKKGEAVQQKQKQQIL